MKDSEKKLKNIFIAQPMKGVATSTVKARMNSAFEIMKAEFPDEACSLLDQTTYHARGINDEARRNACLANSLSLILEKADLVVFLPGWEKASGCRVEHNICKERGISMLSNEEFISILNKHRRFEDGLEKLFPVKPVHVRGKKVSVMISLDHWKTKDNTLYVLSSFNGRFRDGEYVALVDDNLAYYEDLKILKISRLDNEWLSNETFKSCKNSNAVVISKNTADMLRISSGTIEIERLDTLLAYKKYRDMKEEYEKFVKGIYPFTVTSDRYSGTYSGGDYHAWNLDPDDIPCGILSDDVTCANTWHRIKSSGIKVGIADSIEDAIKELVRLLRIREPKSDIKGTNIDA